MARFCNKVKTNFGKKIMKIYIIIDKTAHSYEALYNEKFYITEEEAQKEIDKSDRKEDLFIYTLTNLRIIF